jgi:adenylosuccinate lyase
MHELEALSPLDHRYRTTIEPLSKIFSEAGLIRYRVMAEGEYLIALSGIPELGLKFSDDELGLIRNMYSTSLEDCEIVTAIDKKGYKEIKPTNHDLKAVEYFIKDKLKGTSLEDRLEWTHFALTSEDIKNVAYALMLSDGYSQVIIPSIDRINSAIRNFADKYAGLPMLGRTHGQPASPTTLGKEFKVFDSRLERQLEQLKNYSISTKLNGATGNYNAHLVAYPNVDWRRFSNDFIEHFNLERAIKLKLNPITTQIEPHDTYAELFDINRRLNVVLVDFIQDMWRYISDDWFKQKTVAGEVGSSTMPHKVNPIDFETAEGNLGIANALFGYFSEKLPISRLQRDMSDLTVERNFGVALGHCLIAYNSISRALSKIEVNESTIREALESHPEVVTEGIQTILRREGVEMPYEKLKELSRGKKITVGDIHTFIDGLNVTDTVKAELKAITPLNYVGMAEKLAK